ALPGVALLALLSLTAAVAATSPELALPEQLAASAALVKKAPLGVALVVAAMLALDVGAVVLAKALLVTGAIGKAPTPAQLAGGAEVARVAVAAIVLATPPVACILASLHARRQS
ncbi:MAG: hypothetical protein KIT31_29125, partial [Deltaproteobacteria bacterium]|nr:hypothetical protein [Deltaproteobacteria bacterium]